MTGHTRRRFLGLQAISNQASKQIDQEIERAAMARVLNLGNILELVIDGFNDGAFTQEELVIQIDECIVPDPSLTLRVVQSVPRSAT